MTSPILFLNRAFIVGAFGISVLLLGTLEAQAVELFCPKKGTPTGFVLSIDYANNSVTYTDQFTDGHRSPPITSSAAITDTTIAWAQEESWPWQDANLHHVTYSINRISGEIEYHSINGAGQPETGTRICVNANPQF